MVTSPKCWRFFLAQAFSAINVSQRQPFHCRNSSCNFETNPRSFCLNKVKRQKVSTTTDLKACLILELLAAGIPGASVDYECGGGMHRFVISRQGLRYELSFFERLIEACDAEDITKALQIVVDRIQARSAPRRMSFGAMAHRATAT